MFRENLSPSVTLCIRRCGNKVTLGTTSHYTLWILEPWSSAKLERWRLIQMAINLMKSLETA